MKPNLVESAREIGIARRKVEEIVKVERLRDVPLDVWAREYYVTVLASGALIRYSCNGNPYQVERIGGDYVDIEMKDGVRHELDLLGERRPGQPQPRAYQSQSSRALARELDAERLEDDMYEEGLRAQGWTDREIDAAWEAGEDLNEVVS